jgi:hypothetical protein
MRWYLRIASATILAGTGGVAAAAEVPTNEFENWIFFQQNTPATERWQYDPRLLIPFALGNGWTFTQRVDVPFYYTNKSGPANADGGWKADISDMYVEEIFTTPDVAKDLNLLASVRFVAPTGGQSPFGKDQWQWAPALGFTYRMPDALHGVVVAPLARYFSGFDVAGGVKREQLLDLYPTVTFGLDDRWSLAFYTENPIDYNEATRKWFVPIDALLIYRISKTLDVSFGGASAIVKDDPQYQYLVNARLTIHF